MAHPTHFHLARKIVRFKCPSCHRSLSTTDDSTAGQDVECPKCKGAVRVPAEGWMPQVVEVTVPWTAWVALPATIMSAASTVFVTGRIPLFDVWWLAITLTSYFLLQDAAVKLKMNPEEYKGDVFVRSLQAVLWVAVVCGVILYFAHEWAIGVLGRSK